MNYDGLLALLYTKDKITHICEDKEFMQDIQILRNGKSVKNMRLHIEKNPWVEILFLFAMKTLHSHNFHCLNSKTVNCYNFLVSFGNDLGIEIPF